MKLKVLDLPAVQPSLVSTNAPRDAFSLLAKIQYAAGEVVRDRPSK